MGGWGFLRHELCVQDLRRALLVLNRLALGALGRPRVRQITRSMAAKPRVQRPGCLYHLLHGNPKLLNMFACTAGARCTSLPSTPLSIDVGILLTGRQIWTACSELSDHAL